MLYPDAAFNSAALLSPTRNSVPLVLVGADPNRLLWMWRIWWVLFVIENVSSNFMSKWIRHTSISRQKFSFVFDSRRIKFNQMCFLGIFNQFLVERHVWFCKGFVASLVQERRLVNEFVCFFVFFRQILCLKLKKASWGQEITNRLNCNRVITSNRIYEIENLGHDFLGLSINNLDHWQQVILQKRDRLGWHTQFSFVLLIDFIKHCNHGLCVIWVSIFENKWHYVLFTYLFLKHRTIFRFDVCYQIWVWFC